MSRLALSGFGAVLAALALLPGTATPAAAAPHGVPEQDRQFLRAAHQGHLAVIEAGKLAEQKATNMPIRDFGIRLVGDHGDLDRKLGTAASRLRVSLPGAPTETQQAALDKLRGAEGTEFNAQFVLTQQEEHLRLRQSAEMELSSRSSDSRAKRVAKQSLPVIQSHEDALRDLAQSLGMTTGSTATPATSPTDVPPPPPGATPPPPPDATPPPPRPTRR
ncbi:Predicted outer membrane protein [Micromonospora pattaloongensis]|uniref:Predicted outer membrane protein n=1 Tax=Micromonospora pattaloongensis TaxID=405436 RepID=A0A1H3NXB8_9ACTN|nr:DUF4142 domain-containing protein [Micromonospora pattaloongensis]SDY93353.1 Predicted outer membrane protein [Micromonospora pattaloongensis]